MSRRFEGRVAIVTAAGSGIGAATAKRLAAEGALLVVADLSGTRARATADVIEAAGSEVAWLKMDAAEPPAVEATVALALSRWGRLDVLVNNAGYGEPALLCDTSIESWNRTLAVTLTSVFLGLKHALPVMRRQGRGAVVNTASVSGIAGDIGMPAYNAAKAGVVNLTRAAALECAGQGIRVNCVCPGGIDTRVTQILAGDRADELRRTMAAVHPLQRMGSAEEIAAAIAFLASDEASFITGAALVADGGLTAATGLPPYVAQ
ncbi:SDR family NAD(P)-dependent oxidoreductase [Piscinibacter koreensis]|uniref:SDR family oxidoreductase n=1 Tax=Piscinibacter koreensis TaxID=2742824 RepID=A0A7Y6NQF6_9BURK|nr:SDR family NAD(P)-dependent oxidoreductase [Schlegelella koreensis]NUZ07441.1 SDR family oxidoreductase [Schlegelella koreensis]